MLLPYPASAQEPATQTAPKATQEETNSPETPNGDQSQNAPPGGRKSLSLEEFLVEGKLEKPSAFYVLRRSSLDYDWARLDARFTPLVLESVQDPLF